MTRSAPSALLPLHCAPPETGWQDPPMACVPAPGLEVVHRPRRAPGTGAVVGGAERPGRASLESSAVSGDDERTVEVGGRAVRISRPDKVYFPDLDATKFDLV